MKAVFPSLPFTIPPELQEVHYTIGLTNINSNKKFKPLNRNDYNKLKMHCEKLENIIQILKTCACTVDAPLKQRCEVIKELSSVYSIATLCNALNVPKGSYYNHIFRNKNEDTLLAKRIKELSPSRPTRRKAL